MIDIMDLFGTMLRGRVDEYGNDIVSLFPLSIDHVMENQLLGSAAPILRLNSDVLSIILSYIDDSSLANLALVNRDCRQLARSRQFRSICFDYGAATRGLLQVLKSEKIIRDQSGIQVQNTRGFIGPCVRRLTVAVDSDNITRMHDVELSEAFNALPKEISHARVGKAAEAFSAYVDSIESILSNTNVLPHLEMLYLEDSVPLRQSFFEALTKSSIQHLRLNKICVDQEFEVALPSMSSRWNLKTLHMNITCEFMMSYTGTGIVPICSSLIRSCCHSLETLVWYYTSIPQKLTFGTNPAKIPFFNKLRKLEIGFVDFTDSALADAFLKPELAVVDLKFCRDRQIAQAMKRRGKMLSLGTLIITLEKDNMEDYVSFLKNNPQISKLSIQGPWGVPPVDAPEERILSLLVSSFRTLTSLRITWHEAQTSIPESALTVISGLDTLEQLCLGAGCTSGWKFDWLIDHESLRKHLSLLPRLKALAFTRDSYRFETHLGYLNGHEYYFENRHPSREEMKAAGLKRFWTPTEEHHVWEMGHRKRVVAEAEKYAIVMPRLAWMFVGQYPMIIERSTSATEAQAVPLCDGRDGRSTLLGRMFGWEGLGAE